MASEPAPRELALGPLKLLIAEGDLVGLSYHGKEVVRRIAYPIRDRDWGTLPASTLEEEVSFPSPDALNYRRTFRAGPVHGEVSYAARLDDGGATLLSSLRLTPETEFTTNRAGFVLLHPIAGVTGTPLLARHPDGSVTATAFPDLIAPGQPVFDLAGLSHRVGGIDVDITFDGEVFEMEDQRNWTDASYKTYCRPLALPRPYVIGPDAPVRQSIAIRVGGRPDKAPHAIEREGGRVPAILLSAEDGLSSPSAAAETLGATGAAGLLLRVGADIAADRLAAHAAGAERLALEIVVPQGAEPETALAAFARAAAAVGLRPEAVSALPASYLRSYQPDGPWPEGPAPGDLVAPLRRLFPGAVVGGGAFTNFTELNRCRPDPAAVDFVTFGTNAVVHAADDRSVLETLEALPHVFRSAAAIAGGRPLRLGLLSIGARSNPYGSGVAANPTTTRLAMAMDDPRQPGLFAAAFAVGLLAHAAAAGIAALSPAMTDGPLAAGGNGKFWPLFHVVRAAARLAGQEVTALASGLTGFVTRDGRGIATNLGAAPVTAPGEARVLSPESYAEALANPAWADGPAEAAAPVGPLSIAFLGARA